MLRPLLTCLACAALWCGTAWARGIKDVPFRVPLAGATPSETPPAELTSFNFHAPILTLSPNTPSSERIELAGVAAVEWVFRAGDLLIVAQPEATYGMHGLAAFRQGALVWRREHVLWFDRPEARSTVGQGILLASDGGVLLLDASTGQDRIQPIMTTGRPCWLQPHTTMQWLLKTDAALYRLDLENGKILFSAAGTAGRPLLLQNGTLLEVSVVGRAPATNTLLVRDAVTGAIRDKLPLAPYRDFYDKVWFELASGEPDEARGVLRFTVLD